MEELLALSGCNLALLLFVGWLRGVVWPLVVLLSFVGVLFRGVVEGVLEFTFLGVVEEVVVLELLLLLLFTFLGVVEEGRDSLVVSVVF